MRELRKAVAANMRAIRYKRRLSQEKLAELSGLHRTFVSSVERGQRNISIDSLERIATALGVDIVELLERKRTVN